MSNTALREAIDTIATRLKDPAGLSPEEAAAVSSLLPMIPSALREADPANADPRYAARLARTTESALAALTRLKVHAAHLAERHALHCLAPEELEALDANEPHPGQEARYAIGRPTFKGPAEFLAGWLAMDFHEAKRRVETAHQLIGGFDAAGTALPAQFPKLARRFNDESVLPHPVISAAGRLAALDKTEDQDRDAQFETEARTPEGELVEDVAEQIIAEPDPATRKQKLNTLFKQARNANEQQDPLAATGLFRQGAKNGLITYSLRVMPADAEVIESLIAQADNPRTEAGTASRLLDGSAAVSLFSGETKTEEQAETPAEHPDFVTDEEAAQNTPIESTRSNIPQRRLKAMMSMLRLDVEKLLRRQAKGKAKKELLPLVRPTVFVHLMLDELLGLAKTHGVTAHGLELTPTELRRILAEANIIPDVLGGRGQVLDVGRSQRDYPPPMKQAIKARDRGCIVPGCKVPVEHCEVHHIIAWKDGGVTAVWWAATLCTAHHHDVHAGLIKVLANGGVPQVLLPKFMDPEQIPRRNTVNFPRRWQLTG